MPGLSCGHLLVGAELYLVRGVRNGNLRVGRESHGVPELPAWPVSERDGRQSVSIVRCWRVSDRDHSDGVPGVLAWAVHEQSGPDGVPGVRRRHFSEHIVGLGLPGVLTWSVQQRDSREYLPGVLAWAVHEHSWPDGVPGVRRRHFSERVDGLRLPGVLAWPVQQRDGLDGVPGVHAWALRERGRADGLCGVQSWQLSQRLSGLQLHGVRSGRISERVRLDGLRDLLGGHVRGGAGVHHVRLMHIVFDVQHGGWRHRLPRLHAVRLGARVVLRDLPTVVGLGVRALRRLPSGRLPGWRVHNRQHSARRTGRALSFVPELRGGQVPLGGVRGQRAAGVHQLHGVRQHAAGGVHALLGHGLLGGRGLPAERELRSVSVAD